MAVLAKTTPDLPVKDRGRNSDVLGSSRALGRSMCATEQAINQSINAFQGLNVETGPGYSLGA